MKMYWRKKKREREKKEMQYWKIKNVIKSIAWSGMGSSSSSILFLFVLL